MNSNQPYEKQYCDLVKHILLNGEERNTRNAETKSVFGYSFTIDEIERGYFPLLLGRKLFYKSALAELATFFKGPNHVNDFVDEGCNYWNKWADKNGSLELDYGNAWFNFNGVNQVKDLVDKLKYNPTDRRLIVSGWNPGNLETLSLPCCHMLYQWYVRDADGESPKLDMIWYQRSVDVMVGLPSDVILAAAWNIFLAELVGYKPGKLTFMLGDTHIYDSHITGAKQYLSQAGAYEPYFELPKYSIDDIQNYGASTRLSGPFGLFTKDTITIDEHAYNPANAIKFEVHE